MSVQDNKLLIRRYLDAFNRDWQAATNEYVADKTLAGHISAMQAAFPNYHLEADEMIAEGDQVAVRGKMLGTHNGHLMGIPPTGKQVSVPLIIIYRVAGGKIVSHHMNADQLGLMQQLGVIPAPDTAGA
jgi:predicted ester cyclase